MPNSAQGCARRGRALRARRMAERRRRTTTSATRGREGIAKITIDRPEVRNAFRPADADRARGCLRARPRRHRGRRDRPDRRGTEAFCSGGDQRIRGDDGYIGDDDVAQQGVGRLHVTDLQVQIRRLPKPVVAMVAGYAVGGGHVLHVVCDLTIAADNARFGQTGRGSAASTAASAPGCLARQVGHKKAKEIWFLCRQYDAARGARDGARQHGRPARASSRRRRCAGAARCWRSRRSRCGC